MAAGPPAVAPGGRRGRGGRAQRGGRGRSGVGGAGATDAGGKLRVPACVERLVVRCYGSTDPDGLWEDLAEAAMLVSAHGSVCPLAAEPQREAHKGSHSSDLHVVFHHLPPAMVNLGRRCRQVGSHGRLLAPGLRRVTLADMDACVGPNMRARLQSLAAAAAVGGGGVGVTGPVELDFAGPPGPDTDDEDDGEGDDDDGEGSDEL